MHKSLQEYHRKRNFNITTEPSGTRDRRSAGGAAQEELLFVVQKHHARNLHYDFRLELEGTLKSWAIPKGPSLDPTVKRLAVQVEDHPLSYADFEGTIPKGQYGAGQVLVWDTGIWEPHGDPVQGLRKGKLKFTLHGSKLAGSWNLIRTHFKDASDTQWLLIKEDDIEARGSDDYDITSAQPDSVLVDQPAKKGRSSETPSGRQSTPARAGKTAAKASGTKAAAAGTRTELPERLQPQLATLVDRPPPGDWLYEIKFDGYRLLARIQRGRVKLFSRNGNDWSERLPRHVQALAALKLKDCWLDGEIVVLKDGIPDFQALQNALSLKQHDDVLYYLFDAPFLGGRDLRDLGVEQRRQQLSEALQYLPDDTLRYSETFSRESFRNLYDSACAMSLEGLIGKRADSPYRSERNTDWIKLKCLQRQEFVIVGYTEPRGQRSRFGALLLGVFGADGKELIYCGKVGTGFNQRKLEDIHGRLRKLHRKTSPLSKTSPSGKTSGIEAGVQWLKPVQVCEVEFAQWTREGRIRHSVFVALRDDKPAKEIIREQALSSSELAAPSEDKGKAKTKSRAGSKPTVQAKTTPSTRVDDNKRVSKIAKVSISSPNRVLDSVSGTRKIELAAFYASIADWILPHLRGRPTSLLRAPEGIEGEQFFQKHLNRMTIPHLKELDQTLDPGHEPLMEIDSTLALVGCVQMGSVEFHTWGATTNRIEKPDRIILDLDPDPELPWQVMIEATRLVMSVLDELKLDYFLKTSGGKGMHIVIPMARHLGWDTTKAFARAISQFMAGQLPSRFTAKMGPRNRVDKIFVDYLRNSRGASTVSAWSVRARPGLPVSVPIGVDELDGLSASAQWTVVNLQERLDTLQGDPWEGYSNTQRITRRMWDMLGQAPE